MNKSHVKHDTLNLLHLLTISIDFLLLYLILNLIGDSNEALCLFLKRIEILEGRADLILVEFGLLFDLLLNPMDTSNLFSLRSCLLLNHILLKTFICLYGYKPSSLLDRLIEKLDKFVSVFFLELDNNILV